MAQIEKLKGIPKGASARASRKAKEARLTRERLLQFLTYDPDTGVFRRVFDGTKGMRAGDVAGGVNPNGYWVIRIDGVSYSAHRLAWLYVYGEWPDQQVDHTNAVKDDNRIANLRDLSPSANQQNRKTPLPNNKLGVLGVSPRKGKFRARITVEGRVIELGKFATLEKAESAYLQAKQQMHPTSPVAEGR